MNGSKKAGFFPLFADSSKSNQCCGPDCGCHKSGKSKTAKDTKKK